MKHWEHAGYPCVFYALQMELKECRLRLAEERRARLRAESRLMEVMMISK